MVKVVITDDEGEDSNMCLLNTRCPKKLHQSYKGINTKEGKTKYKTLVDAQTKQWVRPPGMIIGDKSNIRSFQPPKIEHLHFLQQKRDETGRVSEQTMVSLIPHNPDTS
jgi:hypothetical protein